MGGYCPQIDGGPFKAVWFLLLVLALFVAFFAGCRNPAPNYTQGVNVGVGINIPGAESLQLTLFDYISGIKVNSTTSMPFTVTYKEAVTNCYFGVIEIQERRETEVEVGSAKE